MNKTMQNSSMAAAASSVAMFSCANAASCSALIKDTILVVFFFVGLIGLIIRFNLILAISLIGLLSLILHGRTAPKDIVTGFVLP